MEIVICLVGPAVAATAVVCFFFWRRSRHEVADLSAQLTDLSDQLATAQSSATAAQRQQWLATVPGQTYRNEIEVEVKLIAPLAAFAGYDPANIAVRVPVSVQVGRNSANGQADWVLYANGKPRVVIEAKGPGEGLHNGVQGQARSYAFGLNAPLYLITNGVKLALYQRGVQEDQLILSCEIERLAEVWDRLAVAMSPPVNMY